MTIIHNYSDNQFYHQVIWAVIKLFVGLTNKIYPAFHHFQYDTVLKVTESWGGALE